MKVVVQGDEVPTDPQLRLPNGIAVSGPYVSNQRMSRFTNGQWSVRHVFGATWQLYARQPGSYVIGPPNILIGGKRYKAGKSYRVKADKGSGRGRSGRPKSSSSFSGSWSFGSSGSSFSFNFPFSFNFNTPGSDDDLLDDLNLFDDADRSLALPRELERDAFVRVIADKTKAVIGEQITLSFYLYFSRFGIDRSVKDQRDAPLADFLRVPMLDTPGVDRTRSTRVAGRRYYVRLLEKVAIFPLRSGKLHTGSMVLKFPSTRRGALAERKSKDIVIDVRPPPQKGRPPGYRLGDVGSYRLSATVTPREIDAGGSVAVLAILRGTGSLPLSLKLPERTGIEWLEPEKKSEIKNRGGKIAGWRSFGYVVRIHEPGEVKLGRIELPYYDPQRRVYGVAFADLDTIQVRPAAGSAKNAQAQSDAGTQLADKKENADDEPFATLPDPRVSLSRYEPPNNSGFDQQTFWALLVAPPLSVILAAGLRRAARSARRRWQRRKHDAETLAAKALREMRRGNDPKAAAAAAERAIHLAIEGATGLKSRGVLLDELDDELQRRGVDEALAAATCKTLRRCSAIRFEPADDGEASAELHRQAKEVVRRYSRRAARAEKNGAASGEEKAEELR